MGFFVLDLVIVFYLFYDFILFYRGLVFPAPKSRKTLDSLDSVNLGYNDRGTEDERKVS